ncbi:MAG: hypothetical protein V4439_01755 [Patescibacteria group bacterium]
MKIKNKKIKYNSGAAMLISVIFFLFISLAIIAGLVSPSVREFKIARDYLQSRQSFFLSESAIEDSYYRINNSLPLGSTDTLTIGSTTATATIVADDVNNKTITSLGDLSSRQRTNQLKINSNSSVVFAYGTQAGEGGIIFLQNTGLVGNLYSNGPIAGYSNAYVTGNAYAAGSSGTITTSGGSFCIGGFTSNNHCTLNSSDAHAHTITGTTVAGTLYCQTGSSNSTSCNTTQADPAVISLPVTDANITTWKHDAATGTIINGDYTVSADTTLGTANATEITGNLTVNSRTTLTIANTIYVVGNIVINGDLQMASIYGPHSAVIIADGLISTGGGVHVYDSGTAGSYVMLLSTSTCDENTSTGPCSGHNAMDIGNSSDIMIINAQNGTVYMANGGNAKEVVGQKIRLKNNTVVTYGTGSTTANFLSGIGNVWRVSSWLEI